jgi:hypothetical protein
MSMSNEISDWYIPTTEAVAQYDEVLRKIDAAVQDYGAPEKPSAQGFRPSALGDIEPELGKLLHAYAFQNGTRYWVRPQDRRLIDSAPFLKGTGTQIGPPAGHVPKYRDGVEIFETAEFVPWKSKKIRERLINVLHFGYLSLPKAEALAEQFGIELIASPVQIDIMKDIEWSVPMAVSWIAWRDADRTLLTCEKYRRQQESFEQVERKSSQTGELYPVWRLRRAYPESIENLKQVNPTSASDISEAWEKLKNALSAATNAVSSGLPFDCPPTVSIPFLAWKHMKEITAVQPDGTEPKYRSHPSEWYEVRIQRQFVTDQFKDDEKGEGAKYLAVKKAIENLWPGGSIPTTIPAKERDNQIIQHFRANNMGTVSPRTISSVLKEIKPS